ncbi:SDR family oxidoreductase [Streptomyces sp. XM4193]|uniref:SDR family oxidoreductase n=1 Tax=Streptomyces sp. XM4193 TaxID=2929782 RepID=UPI001FF7F1B1|nr:SDR family oxidoreductase [Streptomyces sp. XM4193]MCK1797443.1 SDR family oxidoreductase [Streptomyces sp. XM4193]
MSDDNAPNDPTTLHPRPPFPDQSEPYPGHTGNLSPRPDHGEHSYRGSDRLLDRRALVTGGDSGIGRAVALAFAREGADVALTCLPEEEEEGQEAAELVRAAGRTALVLTADLREEQVCREVVDRTVEKLGGLDLLVNNAAYQMAQPGGLEDITTEQFDRVMKTNLYALFWMSKFALPHLPGGGSIINTASVQGYKPSPPLLDYATTKGGIVTFTQGLAAMVAERGIRVNAVAPGPVWTPLIPATLPETEEFGASTPLGRAAQPAEMAPAYVFLASSEASYVTAEIVNATGGTPLP